MMQITKIIPGILIAAIVFFPVKQCFTGQQSYNFYSETELIREADIDAVIAVNSGTLLNVNIESGTDWKNITLEISPFVYGTTRFRNLNSPDLLYISKTNAIRENQKLLHNLLGFSKEILTNFSDFFADFNMAAISRNPIPASLLQKSNKSVKQGINNHVSSIKYLFKATGSITFHVKNKNGENIISVSKGKFVRQLCCLKLNDREILKRVYYKLI